MQAGTYSPGPVVSATVRVLVAGVERPVESIEWAADTTGGLPDQVVTAGTGMRSRTGTIRWGQVEVVQTEPWHPLRRTSGWPPREGDRVQIDATVDGVTFRRFTGRLGRTTGSLTDGTLASEITDTLGDVLRTFVTVPPTSGAGYMRPSWVAYQAMEQAGLGAIPPPDKTTIAHQSGQSGTAATVGTTTGYGAEFKESGDPYGISAWSGLHTTPIAHTRNDDLLILARSSSGWDSTVRAIIGGVSVVLTFVQASRTLRLGVQGKGDVWSGAYVGPESLPVLAFGATAGKVRVWTSRTTWVDVTVDVPGKTLTDLGGEYVPSVSARLVTIGSMAAIVASAVEWPVSWERSALEQVRVIATRGVENVPARSVIDSWGEATLGAVWMDEYGRPCVVARDRLVARPVSRTLRVEERLFKGAWSIGDDQVRSRVVVSCQEGAVQMSNILRPYSITAWQETSARSFEEAGSTERFIEAPDEVEWGPIDTSVKRGGVTTVGTEMTGTWAASVVTYTSDNDVDYWAHTRDVDCWTRITRLGQRTLKVEEAWGAPPADSALIHRMPRSRTNAAPAIRGVSTPIIRAQWVTTWADVKRYGASIGPSWAPPLEIDSRWWLHPDDAQRVADALAVEVTQPMATLTGVEVLWDPTRQIGDVETWIATDHDGNEAWRADVLVTGYAESWDGRVPSQKVDVRVRSMTDPAAGKTYLDLRAAYGTYGQITSTYQGVLDALPRKAT